MDPDQGVDRPLDGGTTLYMNASPLLRVRITLEVSGGVALVRGANVGPLPQQLGGCGFFNQPFVGVIVGDSSKVVQLYRGLTSG